VRFVTVLAVVLLLVGCSQAAPPVEKQQKREGPERIGEAPPSGPSPDLPAYDITLERDCAETGVVGKCYSVSTDATSRQELELLTADLWLASPRYLAVLVTFYPNKPTADVSAMGFAFENEQAARVVLAQFLAQGTSVEDEVREAMANGGIYVVSPADEARELTQGAAVDRAGEAQAGAVVALASPKAHVAPRGKPGLGRDGYPSLS
jgi:ABC-type Fe3+ transport system substrate-binding protein